MKDEYEKYKEDNNKEKEELMKYKKDYDNLKKEFDELVAKSKNQEKKSGVETHIKIPIKAKEEKNSLTTKEKLDTSFKKKGIKYGKSKTTREEIFYENEINKQKNEEKKEEKVNKNLQKNKKTKDEEIRRDVNDIRFKSAKINNMANALEERLLLSKNNNKKKSGDEEPKKGDVSEEMEIGKIIPKKKISKKKFVE